MSASDLDLSDFRGVTRLFPLPDLVHFPHTVQALHIFEPRYRQMTEHALRDDRLITIVRIKPVPAQGNEAVPEVEKVGCLGRIINCERLDDGRFQFHLLGLKRVRIEQELASPYLYRQAVVSLLDEVKEGTNATDAAYWHAQLINILRGLIRQGGQIEPDRIPWLESGPSTAIVTDVLARIAPLEASERQALLEETRAHVRARFLVERWQLASETRRPSYPPTVSRN